MWPQQKSALAQVAPEIEGANDLYFTLMRLSPRDDTQRDLRTKAAALMAELGELRTLLRSRAGSSVSVPLLVMVVAWIVVTFLSFSLLAPPNPVAHTALLLSALAVASAIFLVLELDRPFGGIVQIPSEPMQHVLDRMRP